jgi:hypothetical protein
MSLFPGTPEMESRSCLETVPVRVPGLWDFIAPRPDLGSGRGLNQSCSPRKELSNAMLHSWSARRKRVDSRLLVVGSQTASLTLGPSFAHNLGYICPNCQCEAIFDIYVSRPFQWHQEHPKARCFNLCCWALNIRESRRTPNPPLFQVLGFTPTLGQSGVATFKSYQNYVTTSPFYILFYLVLYFLPYPRHKVDDIDGIYKCDGLS